MLVKGSSLRESFGGESEIRGYDDIDFEVSSNSHSLGLVFSSLTDRSASTGSSDLSTFLSQLLANTAEKVGESIATLVMVVVAEGGTSQRVASRCKKHPVLKEKCLPPQSCFWNTRGLTER